jgi:hypothetical protein
MHPIVGEMADTDILIDILSASEQAAGRVR